MQKLDSNSFEEIVYDDGEACLVLFSRESCHVCKEVHPKIEELAEDSEYEGKFGFYEVDTEEQETLFRSFNLKGVPQVLFFKDGEFKNKKAGNHDIEEYEDIIDELIN